MAANVSYSKKSIDRAGKGLARSDTLFKELTSPSASEEEIRALAVVNHWRRAHSLTLRKLFETVNSTLPDNNGLLLVGRIKKLETIVNKLRRKNITGDLTHMHDLAGCRLVVPDLESLRTMCDRLAGDAQCAGSLLGKYNYINAPRSTGYRGRHLIFKYDTSDYQGLSAELQVRTKLQHAWATAVESYDEASGSQLKFGEANNPAGAFFLAASRLIQKREEGIDETSSLWAELQANLRSSAGYRDVIGYLRAASSATYLDPTPNKTVSGYFLLDLIKEEQYLQIEKLEEASAFEEYFEHEDTSGGTHDLVLVRANTESDLRLAYPNYFGDVSVFLGFIRDVLGN